MFDRKPAPPTTPAPSPSRRLTDTPSDFGTVIGPGLHFKGEVSGDDSIDLAGTLEGSARSTGLVRVRSSGRVVGDISADRLLVEGQVEAATLEAERIEIGVSARVRATVRARSMAMAEGAFFEGNVDIEDSSTPTSFSEKRTRP
jgi:cytoskeletal protein CcmA (bactofilin family)